MSETKICPFCAEKIKAAAIKCRYCQSDLTTGPRQVAADARATGARTEAGGSVATAVATEVLVEEHPAAGPAEETEGRRPSWRWPSWTWPAAVRRSWARPAWAGSPRLVVVLSALALLLAGGVGYLGYDVARMSAATSARTSGASAAESDVTTILSYSSKSFDRGTAAAERLMTPSFKKQYADTVRLVRKDALATGSTVKAQVVARSVVDASPDRVDALLFVNQTTTGSQLKQPRVDLNRVVVTMVPDGHGGWLVDRLKAL